MFGYSGIQTIPEDLFKPLDELETAMRTFDSTEIKTIPSKLFSNKRKLICVSGCFQLCKNLSEVPKGLFDDCVNLGSVAGLFDEGEPKSKHYTGNTYIPDDIFSKCPKVSPHGSMNLD